VELWKILVRQAARFQACVDSCREIDWEVGPPLINVLSTNSCWETERRINHITRKHPEARRNVGPPRIFAVQRRHKYRGAARRVLLKMNAAHWENRALVLAELRLDLGVEPVLHDETRVEDAVEGEEKLVRTGMRVRDVEPAWLNKGYGARDAKSLEDGKVVDGGEEDGAAFCARRGRLLIKIENSELAERVAGEQIAAAVRQQLLKAIVAAGLGDEAACNSRRISDKRDWTRCSHGGSR